MLPEKTRARMRDVRPTMRTRRNGDFYEVLGVTRGASLDEIKKAYRSMAKQFHPDLRPGDQVAEAKFKEAAAAYEVLSDPERREQYDQYGDTEGFRVRRRGEKPTGTPPPWASRGRSRRPAAPEETPAWQTEERSSNRINEDLEYADKNYCLRAIYRRSVADGGLLLRATFWTFDGQFSRGVLTAFCSEPALGYAGGVAHEWTSSGGSPYQVKAVFATFAGIPNKALLVRILNADVADVSDGLWIDFAGPNQNPWNDQTFLRSARTLVELAEEKAGVAKTGRPKRVSGSFYCAECQRKIPLEGGVLPAACEFCDADLRQFKDWPSESEHEGFEKAWSKRRNAKGYSCLEPDCDNRTMDAASPYCNACRKKHAAPERRAPRSGWSTYRKSDAYDGSPGDEGAQRRVEDASNPPRWK